MTQKTLNIAVAQIDTIVGDIAGNCKKGAAAWRKAEAEGADLVVLPELWVTGYALQDLAEHPDLLRAARNGLNAIIEMSKTMKSGILVGLPYSPDGDKPYNTVMLIEGGKIVGQTEKHELPNYGVFDEKRNFRSSAHASVMTYRDVKIGVPVCEDIWLKEVARELMEQGAQVLVVPNASPYETNKVFLRQHEVLAKRVKETGLPILYVNEVGGQDEVVFDGGSMALNADGKLIYRAHMFEESFDHLKLNIDANGKASFDPAVIQPVPVEEEQDYTAEVIGTRSYLAKTGHTKVFLGMSGGIDSALVAAIAVDAIGPENVYLKSLPYKFSSKGTKDDARIASNMLGANFEELPIHEAVEGIQKALGAHFNPASKGVENENLQARIRGLMLMHFSNATPGSMVLSTGNKSEVSLGYATLYGDMNGGFNPLKDVYKTEVRAQSKWRNKNVPRNVKGPNGPVMPDTIITRPPSAELNENQTDEASFKMPYEQVDPILQLYVENNTAVADVAQKTGTPQDDTDRMVSKVDIAEFKRQQACPGVKKTHKSFGRDRRMPISRPTTVRMLRESINLVL